MRPSALKIAIIAMLAILVLALLYVIVSAMNPGDRGGLSQYARGEMRALRILDEAPPRPASPFYDAEGTAHTLSEFDGQVTLVNFWATWCAPCVVEMPALDNLQAEFGGEDFQVITISHDRSIEDARDFFEQTGLEHLTLYHDNTFAGATAVGAPGLPISILYDRHGREMARMPRDAEWDSDDARALIRAAIDQG
tara:strand:+ start:779 stop:1363 length:585 start_codon:yes stop_codon:yes gene_type:complete